MLLPLAAALIWNAGAHNAFTDLVDYRGRLVCVFREAAAHVSPDGKVRVLDSRDGKTWSPAALLSVAGDLRDPKVTIRPDGALMLTAALVTPGPKRQTVLWTSRDARKWTGPEPIGETDLWLWRVTWHKGRAYGVGYGDGITRLYASDDGRRFTVLVPRLFGEKRPSEATLLFRPDDTALCLLRRDGRGADAMLGIAQPPYKEWRWMPLGVNVGGPNLIELPGGKLLGGGRLYDGKVRTSLFFLDQGVREARALPSGGDSSYPGLALRGSDLWVSYYSSHEGKASIYIERVKLSDLRH